MSILYQALKRREQIESKADISLRTAPGSRYSTKAPQFKSSSGSVGSLLRFVLALAIIGAGGYVAYTTYYTPTEMPEAQQANPQVADAPTPIPSTANVADVILPEIIQTADAPPVFDPTELKSIADVAAMLPDSAQQPLPTAEEKAITVDGSSSPAALSKRAMALQARGANDAAIMLYDEASSLGDADNFSNRVNKWGLIAATDAARATNALRDLVAERPRDAAARAQLGIALVKLGRSNEARTELERAAALTSSTTPESAQVWYNLGVLYDNSQDRTAAIVAYEKAISGAITTNQQDVIDVTALQRRLNYLRAKPAEPLVPPLENKSETVAESTGTEQPMPFTRRSNVP